MKGKVTIAGFFSYVRADDEFENRRISRLRDRLEKAIQFYSGLREFRIFQDWKDIGWGQQWKKVVTDSLEQSIVLFPVVTPSYFASEACRSETLAFDQRQAKFNRDDLILPIYYLLSELMSESDEQSADSEEAKVAQLIKRTQFEDWRQLRRTEETDRAYAEGIERLAERAIPALKRGLTAEITDGNRPRTAGGSSTSPTSATKPLHSRPEIHSKNSPIHSPTTPAEESLPAESDRGMLGKSADGAGYVSTVTVDQMPGRGDFTTISEAIARAAAGARVQIRPGHYREQLVLTKPLELVGDGPREDILVEAEGNVLVFDTNIGVVRGLTLRQSGEQKSHCVLIKQGRLAIEDCDISGANLSCLGVSNDADPRVRRNVIHGGAQSGTYVFDKARGTFEDNEIFGNGYSGFAVKEEAEPIVRRNRVHENMASGIHVYEKGRGTFEDNEIFGNGLSGFSVREEAEPIIRRNRIHENKECGIYVFEKGRGTFEDNKVFGNRYSGVHVRTEGAPLVRRNQINKNGFQAIWIKDAGAGVYEDNDLRDNARGPWDIEASASNDVKRERNIDK